jgi:hypothetical protein
VEQLYLQQGADVCTYHLVSSRFRAFGTPAAVQGSSTEAWVAGSSAAQLAMEDLVASGPPAVKKKHHSVSNSSSAGQAGGSVQESQPQDTSTGQQDEVDTTATVNQQPSPVSATTSTRLGLESQRQSSSTALMSQLTVMAWARMLHPHSCSSRAWPQLQKLHC